MPRALSSEDSSPKKSQSFSRSCGKIGPVGEKKAVWPLPPSEPEPSFITSYSQASQWSVAAMSANALAVTPFVTLAYHAWSGPVEAFGVCQWSPGYGLLFMVRSRKRVSRREPS